MSSIQFDGYSLSDPSVVIAFAVFLTIGLFIRSHFSSRAQYFRKQRWVGFQKRMFGRLRARFDSINSTRSMLQNGYEEYSKNNRSFALPSLGDGEVVVIPPERVQSLSHLPENVLSFNKVGRESVATEYTGDMDLEHNQFHFDIVRKHLTRKLPLLTNDVYHELVLGMQDQWPANKDEWTSVPAYESCIKIVSRAANRVFCGKQLCRNEVFLDAIRDYTQGIFANGFMINMLPRWLRPVLGHIITRSNQRPLKICMNIATPIIEERLAELQTKKPGKTVTDSQQTDALQWLLEETLLQNDPAELSVDRLCRRIIRLNMVAIHTTSLSILGTLLDIYSSPHVEEIVAGLRDECSTVLAKQGGDWDKNAVNNLNRIDSCIRESMRISGLGLYGMVREVVADDGVDLGDGVHIPKGVKVVAPQKNIHDDPGFYKQPQEYDAFRFSRAREESLPENNQSDKMKTILDQKNQAVITTSDKFLAFGHGKHACPGRFFASQEMKLMLAHIVMHYDLRLKGTRRREDIGALSKPDDKIQFEVRLRQ